MLKVVESPLGPHSLGLSLVLGPDLDSVLHQADLLDVCGQLRVVVLQEHGERAGLVEGEVRHSLKGRTYSL